MSTITKEQLIRRAHLTVSRGARELEKHPDRDGVAADIKIASIAARSLMAEPIYQLWDESYYDTEKETYDAALKAGGRGRIVYTAPPAQMLEIENLEHCISFWKKVQAGQMKPGKNDIDHTIWFLEGLSNLTAPPAPVVPEGWIMVPIEPTESMIVDGFESEPDEDFSQPEVWEEYQEMSGCQQAAHRAKLCWEAMIKAAPKPENI